MDIEDKLKAFEVKIRALELTIEKIKVWVWQVYENEIPDDILALATVSSTISKSNHTGNPTKIIPKLEVTELEANSISAQDSPEPNQEFVLPDYIERELNDPTKPSATEPQFISNEDLELGSPPGSNLDASEDQYEPIENSDEVTQASELFVHSESDYIDKLCRGKSENDQILIRQCFNSRPVINLVKVPLIEVIPPKTRQMQLKRKAPEHICSFCPETFKMVGQLNSHLLSAHNYKKPRKAPNSAQRDPCTICGSLLRPRNYNNHMRKYHANAIPTPFKCEGCSRGFATKFGLAQHNKKEHSVSSFFCDLCAKELPDLNHFKEHMKFYHVKPKSFKCKICSKSFNVQASLKKHQETHSIFESFQNQAEPTICHFCGELSSDLIDHISTKHPKETYKFICNVEDCRKKFRSKRSLWIHQSSHYFPNGHEYAPEFAETCSEEQVAFLKKWQRSRSTSTTNPAKSNPHLAKYPCDYCGMMIGRIHMNAHIICKHKTEEKSFPCESPGCGMILASRQRLIGHYKIHLNPNNPGYSEEFERSCPKRIQRKVKRRLKAIADRKDNEYICEVCGKKFVGVNSGCIYKRHLKLSHKIGISTSSPTIASSRWGNKKARKTVPPDSEDPQSSEEQGVAATSEVNQDKDADQNDAGGGAFVCEAGIECGKRFESKFILWEHYHAHLNPRSIFYSEEFSETCPDEIRSYLEKSRKGQAIYANKMKAIEMEGETPDIS